MVIIYTIVMLNYQLLYRRGFNSWNCWYLDVARNETGAHGNVNLELVGE